MFRNPLAMLPARIALALGAIIFLTAHANAATTVTALNMRAGPSTHYPVVTVLPTHAHVKLYGCNANVTWCDISFGSARGWASARYLQVDYRNKPVIVTPAVVTGIGLATVTFNQIYWKTHYVKYPWYGRYKTYHSRARVVRGCTAKGCGSAVVRPRSVTVRSCSDGSCDRTTVRRHPHRPVLR